MVAKSKLTNIKRLQPIVVMSVAAGIIYNSWILGYFLDPHVLHNAYFSVLETQHRPYSWVFILADEVTSILAISVAFLMWQTKTVSTKVIISYGLFALSTFFEAAIPIADKCSSSISACGIAPSQVLSFHDIASLVAYFSIFYCLLNCYKSALIHRLSTLIAKQVRYTYYAFCSLAFFLVFTIVIDKFTTLSQGLFTIAVGVSLMAVPHYLLSEASLEEGEPASSELAGRLT